MLEISSNIENVLYLISASMFILGIKRLASPATARNGNRLSSIAMLIAIIVTVLKYTTQPTKLLNGSVITFNQQPKKQ